MVSFEVREISAHFFCDRDFSIGSRRCYVPFAAGQQREAMGRMEALDTLVAAALALFGEDDPLEHARSRFEKRRSPVLPFLRREKFLNHKLEKLHNRAVKRLGKENG